MAFLELRAFFTGELQRSDIETRFGVKPAAASRDLSIYRKLAPNNLDYDLASRRYRPTRRFEPVFGFQAERVLAWLLHGYADGLELGLRQAAPCEGPGQLVRPNIDVLATITRSLRAKRPIRINYLSLTSGSKRQDIVPVALVDNGLRWHVRAFDRERDRFADFVLTRIENARESDEDAREDELLDADEQWIRIVELELVPHPGIAWPKAVEADYDMRDGALRIKTRAAMAGYVLRRWSVDATPNHSLDPSSHHLWLRNTPTLYGVESASIAPGISSSPEAAVGAFA